MILKLSLDFMVVLNGRDGSIYRSQSGEHVGLIGTADILLTLIIFCNFAIQMKEFVNSIIEDEEPLKFGEKIIIQLKIIEATQKSVC